MALLDCRIPSLMDAITDAESFDEINRFAKILTEMNDKEVFRYKTVIEATECKTLPDAEDMRDRIGEYVFNRNISSPVEFACSELDYMLDADQATTLKPFVDLYGYGKNALMRYNCKFTDYGLISRKDLQPIQTISKQQPQNEMEMM